MTTSIKKRDLPFYFCLVIISVIILIWLISPLFYPNVWNGYFQQEDPDSLLFSRQLEQSILKGKVLTSDNYAAFPYETQTGFAPFYMSFLFYFVNTVYYLLPNISIDPIYLASILPIVIPWLTILFLLISIYKLSKDKILTLFCALGLLPGFSSAMTVGFMKLDYDFLISFYIWSWLIFGAFYIKTEKHGFVYAGTIITALFISTWNGTPFFYFFACIYALIHWLINPKANSRFLSYSALSMFMGSIIALIFVPRTKETYDYFFAGTVARYSFIQGILVFLGSCFLFVLNKLSTLKKPRSIAIIIFGVFAVIIGLLFHETLLQATGILFQKDPIHYTIGELVVGFDFANYFNGSIKDLMMEFTPFLLFLPFCYLIKTKSLSKPEITIFLKWFLIFIILTVFYQIRYIRWLGCGYGLSIGFISYQFWELLKNNSSSKGQNNLFKVAVCLLPILIISISINYSAISSSYKLKKEEVELYSWIKEKTPPTSGYFDDNQPEYSILAYWDQGNKLSFYTKRPVCVSNSMWGYKTMADIFSSSENENNSHNLCSKYGIKYIIINPSAKISKHILDYWPVFKDMPETPEYKLYYGDIPPRDTHDYFYFWLADHLGLTPLGNFTNTEHFRLVFANQNDGKTISKNIMFERVEGAKIVFNLPPESKVSLSLEFKLGEMPFIFKVNKNSDENGLCQYILPYSNSYNSGNVVTDPFYKVSIEKDGKRTFAKLVITDYDVVEGKTVDLAKQFEVVEK